MKRKVFAIFVVYLLLTISISAQIIGQPSSFPLETEEGEKPEDLHNKQVDFIKNSGDFNPSDETQKGVFEKAYQNGDIKLPEDRQIVGQYLSSYSDNKKYPNGIPSEHRAMANEYASQSLGGKNADLSQGKISTRENNGVTYIVVYSQDGKPTEHDISQYKERKDITGIKTTSDGKLILIRKEGNIVLDGTTVSYDEKGNLMVQKIPVSLGDNKGKNVAFRGKEISCEKGCNFRIGDMNVELKKDGKFYNLGDNRYRVEKGITKIGKDKLFGSYEFSMTLDNKKIDLTKKIELLKYSFGPVACVFDLCSGGPTASRARIFKEGHPEIQGLKDDLYFSNGKGNGKVGICIFCNNFNQNEYDGYVNFETQEIVQSESLTTGKFETVVKANIKGLVAVGFGNNGKIGVFHEGFDKALEASYFYDGKGLSGNEIGILRIKDCKDCELDKTVGVQIINGRYYKLDNKRPYPSLKDAALRSDLIRKQIHVKELRPSFAEGAGIYALEAVFPSDSMSNPDSMKYSDKKSLNLGSQYNINSYRLNPTEHIKNNVKSLKEGTYGTRDIYTQHATFQYGKEDLRAFPVNNLYVTTKESNSIIDQISVTQGGYYANFRLRESTKEVIDQVEKEGIKDPKEKGKRFNELMALKQHQIFIETRKQFISGVIDAGSGKYDDNPLFTGIIRDILNTFPDDKARGLIGEYRTREIGAKRVYNLMSQGKTLEQIYKEEINDIHLGKNVQSYFKEPYVVYQMNEEIIANADPDSSVQLYELTTDGKLTTRDLKTSEATKYNIQQVAMNYIKDSSTHFRDVHTSISLLENELRKDVPASSFNDFSENINKGYFEILSKMHYLSKLNNKIITADHAIALPDGRYLKVNPETKRMIEEQSLDLDTIASYIEAKDQLESDEFSQNLKLFVEAIVPKTPIEVALNILPELGVIAKGFTFSAKGFAVLTTKGASAALLGFGGFGGGIKIVDNVGEAAAKSVDELRNIVKNSEEFFLSAVQKYKSGNKIGAADDFIKAGGLFLEAGDTKNALKALSNGAKLSEGTKRADALLKISNLETNSKKVSILFEESKEMFSDFADDFIKSGQTKGANYLDEGHFGKVYTIDGTDEVIKVIERNPHTFGTESSKLTELGNIDCAPRVVASGFEQESKKAFIISERIYGKRAFEVDSAESMKLVEDLVDKLVKNKWRVDDFSARNVMLGKTAQGKTQAFVVDAGKAYKFEDMIESELRAHYKVKIKNWDTSTTSGGDFGN